MTSKTIFKAGAAVVVGLVFLGLLVPRGGSGNEAKGALCRTEMTALIAAGANYHEVYGSSPTGDQGGFIRSLLGNNPRKIVFINLNPDRLISTGDYRDPWGTPYQIQSEADTNLFVRSAGPDKRFGDKDDQTLPAQKSVQ
jgi:Type II secretion system (T2SS), protein G